LLLFRVQDLGLIDNRVSFRSVGEAFVFSQEETVGDQKPDDGLFVLWILSTHLRGGGLVLFVIFF